MIRISTRFGIVYCKPLRHEGKSLQRHAALEQSPQLGEAIVYTVRRDMRAL